MPLLTLDGSPSSRWRSSRDPGGRRSPRFVATARDARRFVVGAVVAIVAWFVVVYPNIRALPLPTAIANVYQGVLPTYLYAFQFPVNNVAGNVPIQLSGPCR